MYPARQGNTQVYSPFGTIVVEQRDGGFRYPRHSEVPEPTPPTAQWAEPGREPDRESTR